MELKTPNSLWQKFRHKLQSKEKIVPLRMILDHYRAEKHAEVFDTLGKLCSLGLIGYQTTGYHDAIGTISRRCYTMKARREERPNSVDILNGAIRPMDAARDQWNLTGILEIPSGTEYYEYTREILQDFIAASIKDFTIQPLTHIVLAKLKESNPLTPTSETTEEEKSLN